MRKVSYIIMRYLIGIDLGTTNSSVAYVDTQKPQLALQFFSIPQLVALGQTEPLPMLPSFCYLVAKDEWPLGSLILPWKEETSTFVGQFAKIQGSSIPTRLVQSAKSWLCNLAANRRDKILPLEAADVNQRLSPVEASAKYLTHIKEAWNAIMAKKDPDSEFEEQDLILTVPASFDEVSRTLTVEAARLAGLNQLTLLEEPQAAFYSWICQHEDTWTKQLKDGDSILVCDVGGGTTDFSLIEVHAKGDQLVFQRMAVGDHLLLGGDNMDAALAHYLEQKIQNVGFSALESHQWLKLQAEARMAKEQLLSRSAHDRYTVVMQGSGSSVVGGSLSVTIERSEVEKLLLEGFFGQYNIEEALHLCKSRGFRTMGLSYEDEPSITKHLAHFLKQAGYLAQGKEITHLLFNGGAMKPESFQQAIYQSLCRWFSKKDLTILPSVSLDLAVARGAAYYGKARRGFGVQIGGGLPRTYYLEVDVRDHTGHITQKALTLLPRGSEEGALFQSEQTFLLRPNRPVAFHLLTSHVRLHDQQGQLIAVEESEMQRLPLIQTVLRFGRRQVSSAMQDLIPVHLGIRLTVIGTLELWLESQKTDHRWNLEFQLRTVTGQDESLMTTEKQRQDETFESTYIQEAKQSIEELFTSTSSKFKPGSMMEKLEELLGISRREWSSSILRGLWEPLLKSASNRKISLDHEARWWNLAGFFLRPGFGFPLDDFRIKELWKIILSELKTPKGQECQIQKWICTRRIAGGLNKGQQMQMASELLATLFNKKTGKIEIKGKSDLYSYSEKIRTLASLERIELPIKIRLGEALLMRILQKEAASYEYWALGRIGARRLVYGSVGQVIPRDVCAQWVDQLLKIEQIDLEQWGFVIGQLARQTAHRELNLPEVLISRILEQKDLGDRFKQLILHEGMLTQSEQEQVLGERLPVGLMLEL